MEKLFITDSPMNRWLNSMLEIKPTHQPMPSKSRAQIQQMVKQGCLVISLESR